jgi:hypothetical protein
MVLGTWFAGYICGINYHLHFYHSSTLCMLHHNILVHISLLPLFDSAWCQMFIQILLYGMKQLYE